MYLLIKGYRQYEKNISDTFVYICNLPLNDFFKVGSEVNCLKIGDNNIVEAKSYLGRNSNLSNGCIIGAGCKITSGENIF